MSQLSTPVDSEPIEDKKIDDNFNEEIDWSEELEEKYGRPSSRERHRESKILDGSLGRQKKIMEENKYYRRSKSNPNIELVDKTEED